MPGCRSYGVDLTAWIEGQLPHQRAGRIGQHVIECAACAAEVDSLRSAIQWQRRALHAVTAIHDIDSASMRAQLRRGLAAQADEVGLARGLRRVWSSMWGRMALAGAAASVAAIVLILVGGPGMVLIPLGLESPPPAVTRHTEFFKDYPLIEQLDVLENFDTVESVPLDDESASEHG